MRPILFHIGPFPVFSYGVFVLLGIVTLFSFALGLGRRAKLTWEQLLPVACGVVFGAIVGARLSHLLVEPQNTTSLLNFYSLFLPGTPGNIVGLMIGGYLGGLMVRVSLDFPPMGNHYALGLAAASVVWRIGCTLGGCCYGKETSVPWGIYLANAYRHPTMIYEGLFNLVMLFVLWRLYFRLNRNDDILLLFYFACYAFFRFWLEFIRVYPPVLFGLTGIQYLCLAILLTLTIWQRQQWRQFTRGLIE